MQTRIQVQFFFGLFFAFTLATSQNVTVDDAVLSGPVVPQYLPDSSAWNIGNDCPGCFVQPDPALAYNHTWHDLTFSVGNEISPGIGISFTGNGLYVFFIIANNVTGATTTTNVSFVLDGVSVGSYTHVPLATTDYEYNVPVFSNGSLENGTHSMLIQPALTTSNSLILFDYLIYTIPTNPAANSTSSLTSPTQSSVNSPTHKSDLPLDLGLGLGLSLAIIAMIIASVLLYRYLNSERSPIRKPEGEE